MTDDGSVEGTLEVRIEGLQPATDYYIRPYVVLPHAVDGERLYYGAEEMCIRDSSQGWEAGDIQVGQQIAGTDVYKRPGRDRCDGLCRGGIL